MAVVGRPAARGEAVQALAARCYAGLDSMSLQRELVDFLGRNLAVDAVFCASVDPATLLFTGAAGSGHRNETGGQRAVPRDHGSARTRR